MRFIDRRTVLILAVLLTGCAQRIETRFDDAMAEAARKQLEPGTGTVRGSAFVRKPAGNFATAGGEWVYLIPVTPYAEERFRKLFGTSRYNSALIGYAIETADPRYAELMHKVKAKKDGNFRFENVKPGRWYVSTQITWTPEQSYIHGGMVYDEVVVKDGEAVEAILSGN
jgi:hypothetical protein